MSDTLPPERDTSLLVSGPDISDPASYAFEAEQPDPLIERTVAFFADPRATTLLLAETVEKLIESLDIQRGLVDISTVVGVRIARVFRDAGLPFDVLEFGQGEHYRQGASENHPAITPVLRQISAAVISDEAGRLREAAAGTREIHVGDLGTIDANVVLIPATVGPDEKLLDFTTGSLLGAVIGQLESAERDFVLVDAPERGLRAMPDGSYQRVVVHVGASSNE
jgi:hypothetical protein